MAWETRIPQWSNEWYGFTDKGMQWLADHGCEWVKVCAEPGDLILWDSRVPHYNLSSTTKQPRFCIYTCYMPVADATQEDLIRKKHAYEGKNYKEACQNSKGLTQFQRVSELHIGRMRCMWEAMIRSVLASLILTTVRDL